MVMGSISSRKCICMKVIFRQENELDSESKHGLTIQNTLGIGLTASNMDKVYTSILLDSRSAGNGLMVNE